MKAALSVKALVSRTGLPARGGELAMAAGVLGEWDDDGGIPSSGAPGVMMIVVSALLWLLVLLCTGTCWALWRVERGG